DSSCRLSVPAEIRLPAVFLATTVYAVPTGLYQGGRIAGLRFLAENSHRLPSTVQGWYFYHKRKNYMVMKHAMTESVAYSTRTVSFMMGLFGIEALLDHARDQIDFLNTTAGASVVGLAYALFHRLPRAQVKAMVRTGVKVGLVLGLAQDALMAAKGHLWY
ncbi:hypothetical protein V1514DRAFT_273952, partial [Lipomyces japonicus]|uniref:uncharacterized protein n=1 Tax=Lipomyces japonicus TaxID=56871 RepID=UPI0034CF1116